MSIKLILLKSGEDIIADVKEILSQDNVVGYLLNEPQSVRCENKITLIEEGQSNESEIQVTLRPWIILSKDKQIPIRPDWLITVVEPVEFLKQMYEEKVNGKSEAGNVDEQSGLDNED